MQSILRPPAGWPMTILCVLLFCIGVAAARWQMGRGDYKEGLQRQWLAAEQASPLDLVSAWSAVQADPASFRYRPVELQGEVIGSTAIWLGPRTRDGRIGYHRIIAVRLAGTEARQVVVDFGWVPANPDGSPPSAPADSGAAVAVSGRVNLPPGQFLGTGAAPDDNDRWVSLDFERLAKRGGVVLAPFMVEAGAVGCRYDCQLAAPDFGIAKHRGYAAQWSALAALSLIGYVILTWKSRRTGQSGHH